MALIDEKIARHRNFWNGAGPSLLLVPREDGPLYDTSDYARRFADPQLMWEAECRRAEAIVDWPTDGIPTVRPNLGVVFIPAIAGQDYELKPDQMPWPGAPLDMDAIRAARQVEVADTELMRRAEQFYRLHRARGSREIAAYHADTQGVFDVAHLLYGDEIFMAMAGDAAEQGRVVEALEISLDLYLKVTRRLKALIDEPIDNMIHGHGTAQGIFFPSGGVRVAEDTAILLSPAMIRKFVLPYIQRSLAPFGGGFVHFCGLHKSFFEILCECPEVQAIDLGNPEKYDPQWLLERCAASGTVLYSRLPALGNEDPLAYVDRLSTLVRQTGARVILRSILPPRDRDEASAMLTRWRDGVRP